MTCPSEEEWHYIEHLIDRFLSGFLSRLAAAHPTLTHNDLHLCCLLRLGLDRYHVACLMGISSSSVSTSKMRIKKKMCVLNPDVWLAEESLESYLLTF